MKNTFTNKIGIKKFQNFQGPVKKQFFSGTFQDQYENDTFFKDLIQPWGLQIIQICLIFGLQCGYHESG